MPGGVAPSLVLEPANAALMAAKILGVQNARIRANVGEFQLRNKFKLLFDDRNLTSKSYVPALMRAETEGTIVVDTSALGQSAQEKRVGKVRDQYYFEDEVVLVTTDRQSAFDRVIASAPFKGQVLNLSSAWWFKLTEHIIPNHVISVPHPNVTVARKCKPFPIEFVVRGYITGNTKTSLWVNYSNGVRNYCGVALPEDLEKHQKLPENILTPTTKEESGDRPISPTEIVSEGWMTQEDFDMCAKASMDIFRLGQEVAREHGLILVDTKYEFGVDAQGTIRLIDEVHTPDSSRFWMLHSYEDRFRRGQDPEGLDKDYVRRYYQDRRDEQPLGAEIVVPPEVRCELARRYIMFYELMTGEDFLPDFSIIPNLDSLLPRK